MKACIIQPPYSRDVSLSDAYFEYKIDCLNQCDASADIIVLPEYSDVPCVTSTLEETLFYHERYIDRLLRTCVETAKRCRAMVFVNALSKEEGGYRNTTHCYDREGVLRGKYFKKHLPPLEMETLALDSTYTMEPSVPYVLEMEGLRFGFLTCYDFYFYESFARIAQEKVDVIIGCSLQRGDSHEAIETMCRFLAYNTNTFMCCVPPSALQRIPPSAGRVWLYPRRARCFATCAAGLVWRRQSLTRQKSTSNPQVLERVTRFTTSTSSTGVNHGSTVRRAASSSRAIASCRIRAYAKTCAV